VVNVLEVGLIIDAVAVNVLKVGLIIDAVVMELFV
jgi:hypothetical protein